MPNATLVPVSASSEMPPAAKGSTAGYRESLRTPWWWYGASAAIAALLAGEFYVGGLSLTLWIPFAILVPLSLLLVWWVGHSRLEIRDGELFIRGAHLPLHYVSGVVALDAATLRRVVGREGDPAAYISIRPWIGPGVQLWLDDPDDPAPYWVVSSRHPQQVVEIVRGAG